MLVYPIPVEQNQKKRNLLPLTKAKMIIQHQLKVKLVKTRLKTHKRLRGKRVLKENRRQKLTGDVLQSMYSLHHQGL